MDNMFLKSDVKVVPGLLWFGVNLSVVQFRVTVLVF